MLRLIYVSIKHLYFSFCAIFCLVLIAIFLAACTRPAKYPHRVSIEDIVNNLQHELCQAVQSNASSYPWVLDWAAGFTLTLKVDRTAGISSDTSGHNYVVPIPYGTFRLGIGLDLDRNAIQTAEIDFNAHKLRPYMQYDCTYVDKSQKRRRLLSGEIGLYKWLNEIIPQISRGRIHQKFAKSITYTMTFVVTTGGSLRPSWALSYPSGRMVNAAFSLGGTREATHKLNIVLSAPVDPDPTLVELTVPDPSNPHRTKKVIAKRVFTAGDPTMVEVEVPVNGKDTKVLVKRVIVKNFEDLVQKQSKVESEAAAAVKTRRSGKVPLIPEEAQAEKSKELEKAADKLSPPKVTQENPITVRPAPIGPGTEQRIDDLIQRQIIRDALGR